VDRLYLRFGAPKKLYGGDKKETESIRTMASRKELEFIPTRLRHIGTDRCLTVLKRMEVHLKKHVTIRFDSPVQRVLAEGGRAEGVRLQNGTEYRARRVILAPGREGSKWLEGETKRLRLRTLKNPVDIGVRVEVPASVMEHLTSAAYEPKFLFYSRKFDDKVRTFCVNPFGEVVKEYLKGVWTVNGHSYTDRRTANTNFALLVSTTFTAPFNEPISYGRYIAGLANFLGKGVIVQRLGDLLAGRRSTPERIQKGLVQPTLRDATPGDLSFVLPYRYVSDILEMLKALDGIAPGVNSRHTLLYGIEVKFYSMQLDLSPALETQVENLYAVGDGAGVSRGLIQASVSGVVAARQRNEHARGRVVLLEVSVRLFRPHELLGHAVPHRSDDDAPGGKLFPQGAGNGGCPGCHEYAVEGSFLGPAEGSVSCLAPDVLMPEPEQSLLGLRAQLRMVLDGEDFAAQFRENGGLVARACSYLKHPLVAAECQDLRHDGHHIGLGNGLSLPDGERTVLRERAGP
jgi:uncharacterized FAD-dependent dehydrogenase